MATTTTRFTVTPASPSVGAIIDGLDLREPLDEGTVGDLLDAFHAHIALVFRDQDLSQEQQIRFACHFGALGRRSRAPQDTPLDADNYDDAIMLVTNIKETSETPKGSFGDGEMWWHHDTCYYPVPNRMTLLYAIELPSWGGNTRVNNMYAAYDAIPGALKDRLEGRTVLQIHDYKRTERIDPDGDISNMRHCRQPIFITHPVTKKRALYVNRLMSAKIDGFSRAESDDLLEQLFEIAEDPAFYYEHEWRVGDILLWDNRCSMHARTLFPNEERRLLRRCTVKGEAVAA